MAGNSAVPGRSVSSKLLTVLDCFDVDHPLLTLTEISTRTGLPLSTARRLVLELAEWGGLDQLPDGRYRVGMRLWRVGSMAPQQRDLREAALPYMQDLCAATQENVQLVVLDGLNALCIEKISSPKAVGTATQVGGRLPLHATAVGKVLLAFSSADLLRELVKRGLRRATPYTIVEPGRLAGHLNNVRATGLGFAQEEMTLGAVSVAAPILTEQSRPRAAIGIVTHSHARLERLVPAVRAAALGISRIRL